MQVNRGAVHEFLRRYGVPEGWEARQLGTLAEVVGGGTPSRDESRFWTDGNIPWATPTDLTSTSSKYLLSTAEQISQVGLHSSAAQLLPKGTVLFTSRATIGAKAIAATEVATNQGFASFIPKDIESEYLYYLLDLLLPTIKRLGAGTTFDEVSKRDIRRVWCAIPKSSHDRETIVAVMSCIDRNLEWVRAAELRAKDLRSSLVHFLFSHGTRGQKQYKTALGFIPKNWEVLDVKSVCSEFQYGMSVAMETAGTIPILRMGNIQDGNVMLSDLKFLRLPDKLTRPYLLKEGDVLFNRTNSQDLVGKVGIYRSNKPCVFASYLIRLKCKPDRIDNFYLGHLLNSYAAQCRIKRYATPGVQQVNINAKNLGKVLIPVPKGIDGIQEQQEISQIIEQAHKTVRAYQPAIDALEQLKKCLSLALLTGKATCSEKKMIKAVGAR